jgi:hypothetical protein
MPVAEPVAGEGRLPHADALGEPEPGHPRAGGSGGGHRIDSTRVAATAAASAGMSRWRPSGTALSWLCTRMSRGVSRRVTPKIGVLGQVRRRPNSVNSSTP